MSDTESAIFLRNVANAVGHCYDYDVHSSGQGRIWATLLAMVTPKSSTFRFLADSQMFLSTHLIVCKCTEGIAFSTRLDKQVNVNIAVLAKDGNMKHLVIHLVGYFETVIPGCVINLTPLATHVSNVPSLFKVVYARFVSTRDQVTDLVLIRQRNVLCLRTHETPVVRYLGNFAETVGYVPLVAMTIDDPEEQLYWVRLSCNTLVVLCNPSFPLHPGIPIPDPMENGDVKLKNVNHRVCTMIQALYTDSFSDIQWALRAEWVPTVIRAFYVNVTARDFGITDELISEVGFIFEEPKDSKFPSPLVRDLCDMHRVMRTCVKWSDTLKIESISRILLRTTYKNAWQAWSVFSPFVYATLSVMSASSVIKFCRLIPCIKDALAAFLESRKGCWTALEVQKAQELINDGNSPPWVEEEVSRLFQDVQHMSIAEELCAEPKATSKASKKKTRRAKKGDARTKRESNTDTVVEVEVVKKEAPVEEATHSPLVERLGNGLLKGWSTTLIGSGIFFSSNDADLVVCVPEATTLEDAYQQVIERTGWIKRYDAVGEHVAVLRGTFDGVTIDAQVSRGAVDNATHAESQTQSALLLSHMLSAHSDATSRQCVRWMHQWAEAAGVKGHTLLRLPGVGVTIAAIVLSCHRRSRDEDKKSSGTGLTDAEGVAMLEAWRDALRNVTPCMNLDEQKSTQSDGNRPLHAAQMIAREQNVATRLTAATTRHLLDVLAFAVHLCNPRDPEVYKEWRQRTLVRAVCVRPRGDNPERTFARLLPTALASLNCHPFVDTVHVTVDASRVLTVWVGLLASADVDKYGFREGDRTTLLDGGVVRVSRGARTWNMLATDWGGGGACGASSVCQMRPVGDAGSWVVPNAPYLAVDVAKDFDQRHWECVWEE